MKKTSILSTRLKIAREKIGWTQEQAAIKLNISIGTLSGYERGYRSPNPEMIEKIAEAYNVPPDYLFGWSDDPKLKQIKDSGDLEKIEKLKKTMDMAFLEVREIMEKYAVEKKSNNQR